MSSIIGEFPGLVTYERAQEILGGIGKPTLIRFLRRHDIPTVRVGRRKYIAETVLRDAVNVGAGLGKEGQHHVD